MAWLYRASFVRADVGGSVALLKAAGYYAMIKILYSSTSPYSAKVRMAATHAGVAFESVLVDTNADPILLTEANPLGKIPVLITNDEEADYDSRVITQYLNRVSSGSLFPAGAAERLVAERQEALADGIIDCLLAHCQSAWNIDPLSASNIGSDSVLMTLWRRMALVSHKESIPWAKPYDRRALFLAALSLMVPSESPTRRSSPSVH